MIDPINIREVNITSPDIQIPRNFEVLPPPITTQVGVPIIEMPGCVEAREPAAGSSQLFTEDSRGNLILCSGNVPSYDPIEFEPNRILPTKPSGIPKREENKKPTTELPADLPKPAPPVTAAVACPTPAQEAKEPVGTYIEGFRKKVTGYELIGDQCIQLTESVAVPEQIVAGLPSGGQVMMTGGIAVIATTSAIMAKPLADILLKVVKPTVKKVMKKINTVRGKPVEVLSTAERRNEQRARNRVIMELRQTLKPK